MNALKTRAPLTWEKIRAILQLGRKAEIWLFLPIKFEYFIIEKLNLQKISHTAHINFTAYLFLYFKINICLSAVFTSSGLLRKNPEHPLIFHLLDEALRFHVQARIFLH